MSSLPRKALSLAARWTMPPAFLDAGRKLRQNRQRARRMRDPRLRRNAELRGRHAGERCFLLATGPSIKEQNLKPLQKERSIGLSFFFRHPDYELIQPDYHCIAPFHEPISEEGWAEMLRELEAAAPETRMLFGMTDYERNLAEARFRNHATYFVDSTGSWEETERCGLDLCKPTPPLQSVTVMALFAALHMGFQEIYLVGFDHDWILHLNESSHFYDKSENALYRAGYDEFFPDGVDEYFRGYVQLWDAYRRLDRIAGRRGARIFNATRGGLLDVFPRVELESLFQGAASAQSDL